MLSEISANSGILSADLNLTESEIAVLCENASICTLDLETQKYATVVRSHSENVTDFALLPSVNALVSVARDECAIKVWDCASSLA